MDYVNEKLPVYTKLQIKTDLRPDLRTARPKHNLCLVLLHMSNTEFYNQMSKLWLVTQLASNSSRIDSVVTAPMLQTYTAANVAILLRVFG